MPQNIHPQPFVIHPPEGLVQSMPELRRLGEKLAQKYADRQLVTENDLRAVGGALWMTLGLESSFQAARQAAGAAILPVIVESASAEIQALPWETLHHPELGFLGLRPEFTLARRLAAPQGQPRPSEKGPLRVLLFTSLPDDLDAETGRLNVELEQEQVQEALLPWVSQGLVRLEMPDDGRFATFKGLLKSFQPHLVFLSGHGRFHHQPHSGEAPYGEFLFEGEMGQGQAVRDAELAGAFVGSRVQGVVLSACESGKAVSDALNHGLMQKLGELGIPHVIGMRESVLDRAGIQFARALCDEVARQERLDYALQTARAAIQTPLRDIARREADPGGLSELSLGQWCLPMLLAPEPAQPLVDWDFSPAQGRSPALSASLDTVRLPAHFIGRRAEMRQYKQQLLSGKLQKLLITGPGGQGKTALAGKLMLDLKAQGYSVFAWSARLENPWRAFQFDLEMALVGDLAATYDRMRARVENDAEHAELLLGLLARQCNGRLALLLDNLESLQDPDTLAIRDARLAAWLETARRLPGVTLLATSRWLLPGPQSTGTGWDGAHLPLTHASYGDFLQMAQRLVEAGRFSRDFLRQRENMRRVYAALGGNGRGLEFFAAALDGQADQTAFLERLAQAREETQADMALAAIVEHLSPDARALLARLPVYPQPVPVEGMLKLADDLPDPQGLLARLAAVSLVEQRYAAEWDALEYALAPLAADWLAQNHLADPAPRWLEAAADYELYLYTYERETLSQAMRAHAALRRAGRQPQADRLVLDDIIGPLNMAGFYHSLLEDWLPQPCQSEDLSIRGEALGQTGKQYLHLGDYETALAYLKQSLTIMQQIGDKAGLCATLLNMGHIYAQNEQMQEAVSAWVTVYKVARQINEFQALQALANLAPQLGLPLGLDGWERLAQRMK